MKNFTLAIFFVVFGIFPNVNAQCTAIATGFGNNTSVPMYNITGANSVQVVLNTDNTVTLNTLSNFNTSSGPDVRVFLVNPGSLTNAQLKTTNPTTLPNIFFGIVSSNTNPDGAHSFTSNIPFGVNISSYTKVFFYCVTFSQFWDFGTITPFTSANCSVLGTDNFTKNNFKVYPNPVSNELNIDLDSFSENDLSVKIYSSLGSLITLKHTISIENNKVDVSQLNNGIYFIEIGNKENERVVKRFIKQN
jgi:hypothetical protein